MKLKKFVINYFVFLAILILLQVFSDIILQIESKVLDVVSYPIQMIVNPVFGASASVDLPLSDISQAADMPSSQFLGVSIIHLGAIIYFAYFSLKNTNVITKKYRTLFKIITIVILLTYPIFFHVQTGGLAGYESYRYSIITLFMFFKGIFCD